MQVAVLDIVDHILICRYRRKDFVHLFQVHTITDQRTRYALRIS